MTDGRICGAAPSVRRFGEALLSPEWAGIAREVGKNG